MINTLTVKLHKYITLMLQGAMIFGWFNFPMTSPLQNSKLEARNPKQEVQVVKVENPLPKLFFGSKPDEVLINKKMEFVATRPMYEPSLAVVIKYENTIKEIAKDKGVPEHVAIGVALLENGGGETKKSPAGALGIFQLMPGTARGLGLTVNKKIDERKNPNKNIEAGLTYLKNNYERFGDWGLATWAYHAGEGNVGKALKIYRAKHGKDAKPSVHTLLSDPNVKKFTKKLNDDSAGYPYKVIATSKLFEESKTNTSILPGSIADRI